LLGALINDRQFNLGAIGKAINLLRDAARGSHKFLKSYGRKIPGLILTAQDARDLQAVLETRPEWSDSLARSIHEFGHIPVPQKGLIVR
jgi:hypothetical protein